MMFDENDIKDIMESLYERPSKAKKIIERILKKYYDIGYHDGITKSIVDINE